LDIAIELFSEALAVYQQVFGPIHAELVPCLRYLLLLNFYLFNSFTDPFSFENL